MRQLSVLAGRLEEVGAEVQSPAAAAAVADGDVGVDVGVEVEVEVGVEAGIEVEDDVEAGAAGLAAAVDIDGGNGWAAYEFEHDAAADDVKELEAEALGPKQVEGEE